MPYASAAQRAKFHADPKLRPIAERWDKEYGGAVRKHAGSRLVHPMDFPRLHGQLVGISDRLINAHLELYRGYVDRLNAVEARYPMVDWGAPAGSGGTPAPPIAELDLPVAQLDLRPGGILTDCTNLVVEELRARGIPFTPAFYLGEGDFWTTDRAVSINVPWFLAEPRFWALANENEATQYEPVDVIRCLRHEVGHAVNYAYELWRRPDWAATFGDFLAPYKDAFAPDPASRDFVSYLTDVPAHYGQKHPDEDWAETFALWLELPPEAWRDRYATWPAALAKLEYVDRVAREVLGGEPTNLAEGRPASYRTLRGTVRQLLGLGRAQPFTGGGWSEHSELLRREPELYSAVVLHEAYFGNLGAGAAGPGPGPFLFAAATEAFGSWDSYLADLRAIAGTVNPGWALTVWDPRRGRLRNVLVEGHALGNLPGCPVLLACDVWEHSYAMDLGTRKDVAVGTFFRNVDWGVVEARLAAARPTP